MTRGDGKTDSLRILPCRGGICRQIVLTLVIVSVMVLLLFGHYKIRSNLNADNKNYVFFPPSYKSQQSINVQADAKMTISAKIDTKPALTKTAIKPLLAKTTSVARDFFKQQIENKKLKYEAARKAAENKNARKEFENSKKEVENAKKQVTGYQPTPLAKLEAMSFMEAYNYYMELVTTETIKCNTIVRYGNIKDGGWEVCEDPVYKVEAPCLVYSMGIRWDFSFDDQISKAQGCEVHAFDPSLETKSFNRSNLVHFHNYGLKGYKVNTAKKQYIDQTKFELKNLEEILTELGHKETTIDYFKMDIDGPEWRSMELILDKGLLKHVRQFAWEFHIFKWEFNKEKFIKAIVILEKLRAAGFEMYYSHENPMGMYKNTILKKTLCCCYENYYVNTMYVPGKNDV